MPVVSIIRLVGFSIDTKLVELRLTYPDRRYDPGLRLGWRDYGEIAPMDSYVESCPNRVVGRERSKTGLRPWGACEIGAAREC